MACSSSKPSNEEIEIQLKARHMTNGSLVDWKKINSEEFLVNGQPHFKISYRVAKKFDRNLVYVPPNVLGRASIVPASEVHPIMRYDKRLFPIAAGAIALYEGEVQLKKTEKGWKFEGIADELVAHCPKSSTVKECWKNNDL